MKHCYSCIKILYIPISATVRGRAYDTHLNDLIVLQNKIIHIITGVPPRTNVKRMYVTMDSLSLKCIYNYAIGLFMYIYVNNMLPELFVNLFSNVADLHHYNTRHANRNSIYVTFDSSSRGQQSLSHCGPRIILSSMMSNCAIGIFKAASPQLFRIQMRCYLYVEYTYVIQTIMYTKRKTNKVQLLF